MSTRLISEIMSRLPSKGRCAICQAPVRVGWNIIPTRGTSQVSFTCHGEGICVDVNDNRAMLPAEQAWSVLLAIESIISGRSFLTGSGYSPVKTRSNGRHVVYSPDWDKIWSMTPIATASSDDVVPAGTVLGTVWCGARTFQVNNPDEVWRSMMERLRLSSKTIAGDLAAIEKMKTAYIKGGISSTGLDGYSGDMDRLNRQGRAALDAQRAAMSAASKLGQSYNNADAFGLPKTAPVKKVEPKKKVKALIVSIDQERKIRL